MAPAPDETQVFVLHSILFPGSNEATDEDEVAEPSYFPDLNLDQIVSAVAERAKEYRLASYYRHPLLDREAIRYRQDVFVDLERPDVRRAVDAFVGQRLVFEFAERSRQIRDNTQDLSHYHRARFFLTSAERYCDAVLALRASLDECNLRSRGLLDLLEYLARYVASEQFLGLHRDAADVQRALDGIRYNIAIRGRRISVGPFDDEADYGQQVAATFARFRTQHVPTRGRRPHDWDTYAATGVQELLAQVYPETYAALDQFCEHHLDYLQTDLAKFDREVHFYLAYLDYLAPLRSSGLSFSYPLMSPSDKSEHAVDTFDLALAASLAGRRGQLVCNDVELSGSERILVVSGPNNGGKTTLARAFGQIHHLARLGCAVPGRDVRLLLCDQIFVHFERAEEVAALAGKLQEELVRLRDDFAQATERSVFVLNEVFSSATAQDALLLSRRIVQRLMDLDAVCVCVTFLDELANCSDRVVSMVSTVQPDDPASRTYRIVRRAADGRAYARAVADKYGLGYRQLVEEISR